MRICMLTRTYPPRIGGPGSLVYRLSKELVKRGYDIGVITQAVKGSPDYEKKDGVKIYRTYCHENEFSKINLTLGTLAFTKRIMKELNNYDAFHAHDISIAGFSGCVAKSFSEKPFFLKYGGTLVFEYLSLKQPANWDPKRGLEGTLKHKDLKSTILREIEKWYFRRYNVILPDSEYGKAFLQRAFNVSGEKLYTISNGVDTREFQRKFSGNIFEDKFGINGKIIFTAARITSWKGIDVLIKAVKLVPGKDVKLVIGGDGPVLEKYKALAAKLGLEKRVFFLGKINVTDMPHYLNSADVFALASYFDTSPNVLIEAMASGKPCVVSDIDGIREVVLDKYALKAKVANPQDFSKKLSYLCSNESFARKLGKLAAKRAKEKYDMKSVVKNYDSFYRGRL